MRNHAMTVAETIIAKVRQLSAEDQRRVLELISSLPSAEQSNHGSEANGMEEPGKASIWAKLHAMGQAAEVSPCDLPADLAANHDFYLHGLPRRS
jgi:hypothetical protein